ncbi:GIY-YIG nuclease family protein [Algihabitans sp.]|uniref:GIY-YIG nuclease family protein n=1 Tax=Algihabitans sp. TaxID=2821514 RepID=UPI003BA9CA3C
MPAWLYILRCADGSYYTGVAQQDLERRIAEHNEGSYRGFTSGRRPVTLAFSQVFERADEAIAMERRIKGWSRAKKEALMAGDWTRLRALARSSET